MPNTMKWFKVWETLLVDMIIHDISLEDIGRFTILGLLITKKGKKGQVMITPEALKTYFKCESLPLNFIDNFNVMITQASQSMKQNDNTSMKRMITNDPSFDGVLSDNAHDNSKNKNNLIVSLKNWRKYQENSTGYERLKRWRLKHKDDNNDNSKDNSKDNGKNKIKNKIKNKNKEEDNKEKIQYPDWLPIKPFNDFKAKRRELKKPLTGKAEELAIGVLLKLKESGNDPQAVLEQSIMNSWQGLFEIKNNRGRADATKGKLADKYKSL